MSLEEKRRLLLAFDALIRSGFKGTPLEYAQRLKISRSTFFRLVDYMKSDLQTPISYSTDNRRYVYEKEGILLFGFFSFDIINRNEFKKIRDDCR
ncbi:MAG: hypothetical protein JNJ75_00525 [Cyclobacteriaceae bacterium]|nr:hypothetical protein [Cyclobacteriaceae bacterium]